METTVKRGRKEISDENERVVQKYYYIKRKHIAEAKEKVAKIVKEINKK